MSRPTIKPQPYQFEQPAHDRPLHYRSIWRTNPTRVTLLLPAMECRRSLFQRALSVCTSICTLPRVLMVLLYGYIIIFGLREVLA